jgi:hypothetical protein
MWMSETGRRFMRWLRNGIDAPLYGVSMYDTENVPDARNEELECPWQHRWDFLPKRTAGFGFTDRDYQTAKIRAEEVARLTVGDDLWKKVKRDGYVELPSSRFPGVTYRLRIGRRVEVRCAPGVLPPWRHPFLCINPAYPLPEAEFFAQLYLYLRDNENEVIRVAAPQPWDQELGRTF